MPKIRVSEGKDPKTCFSGFKVFTVAFKMHNIYSENSKADTSGKAPLTFSADNIFKFCHCFLKKPIMPADDSNEISILKFHKADERFHKCNCMRKF